MNSPRPNLFVIGAMKSATTYFADLLRQLPQVFVCSPKEPCYFVDGPVLRKVWPLMWQRGYWASEQRYLQLFAGAGERPILVDASTTYSKAPLIAGVPERILAFNPQARFVYLMRDPVARTMSHYWHRVRWWGERRAMLAALQEDPHYLDTSHYAMQILAYRRCFGAERIYTMTTESLLADPAGELLRVCRWLGIDAPPPLVVSQEPVNVTPEVVEMARGFGLLQRIRSSPWLGPLGARLPQALRDAARQLAVRSIRTDEVPTGHVVAFLRSCQQPQVAELAAMLGRDFPEWTLLHGGSAGAPGAVRSLAA